MAYQCPFWARRRHFQQLLGWKGGWQLWLLLLLTATPQEFWFKVAFRRTPLLSPSILGDANGVDFLVLIFRNARLPTIAYSGYYIVHLASERRALSFSQRRLRPPRRYNRLRGTFRFCGR